MTKQRSFAGSFCRVTHDKEKCALKNHYRGAMREVVGFLDMLAARDPERFVYCGVDAIQRHCKKFQSKNLHSKTWVEKVLAELRHRHVVSRRLVRVRRYEEVAGFIVAPHSCLTKSMPDDSCIFHGPVCGNWAAIVKTDEERERRPAKPVLFYWEGCAAHSTVPSMVVSTEGCMAESTEGCMDGCMDATSVQASVETKLNSENAGLTVVAVGNEEPREHVGTLPALPAVSAPQNQQRQAGMAGASLPSSPQAKATPTAKQRFFEFLGSTKITLPDSLRYATPKPDEFEPIAKQIEAIGENKLADIIYEWEEQQSPPLRTLLMGRWTRWLETGKLAIADALEEAEIDREIAARQAAKNRNS
jgi:hypothetical protein